MFLRDWSLVADEGARRENMVASHLLKAVHGWTDLGLGDYDLFTRTTLCRIPALTFLSQLL